MFTILECNVLNNQFYLTRWARYSHLIDQVSVNLLMLDATLTLIIITTFWRPTWP